MASSSSQGWKALGPGDIVDIVAPSWKVDGKDFKKSVKFIESLGLVPRYPKNILGKDLFCANSLELRTEHLIRAIRARDSHVIWALRGGHGAAEILPFLKKVRPVKNKFFMGFSDITSLHVFFNQSWGWQTIHGPNLNGMQKSSSRLKFVREVRKVIFSDIDRIEFLSLRPLNDVAAKRSLIKSKVLSLLQK